LETLFVTCCYIGALANDYWGLNVCFWPIPVIQIEIKVTPGDVDQLFYDGPSDGPSKDEKEKALEYQGLTYFFWRRDGDSNPG
jgi:hypothetical protein